MDYLLKAAKHVPYILMFSLLHTNVPFIVVVPCLLLARILTAAEHKFIMFNAIFNTANMLYDVYCRYCWTYLFIYRLVTLFLMEFNHKTLVFALQKTHLIWKRCHLKLQIFTTFFFVSYLFIWTGFVLLSPFAMRTSSINTQRNSPTLSCKVSDIFPLYSLLCFLFVYRYRLNPTTKSYSNPQHFYFL